ncbi:MAG: hypothetical protein JKX73_05375 [Flavobacteriales bacterium]|nr:hypothetical protein [Flavobacteriales bacterium]
MRWALLLASFLLSFVVPSYAQDDSKNQSSMNSSIDLRYGVHYLRKDSLDLYLNTKDSVNFFKYSQLVGIGIATTFNTARFKEQDGFISIQYQLPNTIYGYDSIAYTFTGYQIGFCMGGKDLLYAKEDLDLIYSFGVQFGYYYLKRENQSLDVPIQRSKNGIIAPQLVAEARYFIGWLKLGFNMRVQYDVSGGTWNHVTPSGTNFGGFKATGFAFQGVIGVRLN